MFAVLDRPDKAPPAGGESKPFAYRDLDELENSDIEKYDVFLVEDDTDDRILALKELKKSPYIKNVRFFRNGDELISWFGKKGYYSGNLMRFMPSLILLDIHLPGVSGLDILRQLKEHPATAEIPVIIITEDTSEEAVHQAKKLKANAFISKPIRLENIHSVVETGWGWPDAG